MKQRKVIAILAVIMVLVLCIGAFAACNPKDNGKKDCNHEWGEWKTLQEATCTTNGLKERTCKLCDETEEETIAATGHKFNAEGICSVCGAGKNSVANLEYGKDYVSLYTVYGSDISIADVKKDNGGAYIEKKNRTLNADGKWVEDAASAATKRYLGLDFLSMAMVYNTKVPANSTEYKTENDVYAKWWMYFIERWNELLPEIPLYSNEYYDLYHTKLSGLEGHYATNPYWSAANAIVGWKSTDGKAILGNTTDLSGKFRFSVFGASSPGAADNDISLLTSGLSTVTTNAEGGYQWNDTAVKSHSERVNADGTKTFTIELHNDLKFSDGSAINVDHYLVSALVFSTPVAEQAAGKDHKAGMSYVGYNEFAAYNGSNDGQAAGKVTASKSFKGFKKINDYKFEVTVTDEYANYFYGVAQAGFGPECIEMWVGKGNSIAYDADGHPYLSDGFYAKNDKGYTVAETIKATASNTDTTYPYSGPYVVESYDAGTKTATLKKNTYFKGDVYGTKPSIDTITYKKIVAATQLADFKAGGVDFLAGITGGKETDDATKYADSVDTAAYIHYGRAGYGKLGLRSDFGPTQFTEVRKALAYCLDRGQFALDFNGGYGGKVDGPYYAGSWMYQAVKDEIKLNEYSVSLDEAKAQLVAGGWVYNEDGTKYDETASHPGVRYKLIEGSEMLEKDVTFAAKDGSAKVVPVVKGKDGSIKVAGKGDTVNAYLMPLVINWYGTEDNDVSTLITSNLCTGKTLAAQAGFKVCYTLGQFAPMLDELYQAPVYGFYGGVPKYNMFNFATGFNSAAYDYAYNCTIDPGMYDDYSQWYLKDSYDYYRLAK